MTAMTLRTAIFGALCLALAACSATGDNASTPAAAVKAVTPPAGTKWSETVVATPDGGFQMGNPNAPLKLVEYGSVSCPACAAFSNTGFEPMRDKFIETGKISYEYRSYLIHGPDVAITMALQCGGPAAFFPLLEQSYADQRNWLTKLGAMSPDQFQQFPLVVATSGHDVFVNQRGVSKDALDKCLADKTMPDTLVKMRNRANSEFNIPGTPTFILNGKIVPDAGRWEDLEGKLRLAGA
jgi:protein-disulfide isomerase